MTLLTLHCGGSEDDVPTLDVVADQITFKSVETLGAHHMLATIRQDTQWGDGGTETHEESVELAWNNWDNFHLRRVVRGATVAETIVVEGQSYHRGKGPGWQEEVDAEPARMRVRTSWNVWDTAMDVFASRVTLTESERSVVDGRPATRFKVDLSPLPPNTRVNTSAMSPQAISGEVWLDEKTAVRLASDVDATVTQKGMSRTTVLHLRRGSIGQEQTIQAPERSARPSTDILKARARGRRDSTGRIQPNTANP